MDAAEARQDGAEAALADKRKRKDAEEEEGKSEKLPFRKDGEKECEEEGDPRPLKADKKADAYADSAEISNELSEIQTDADRASSAWNESARHPWNNETPDQYRRRSATPHQKHSQLWKGVNLRELSGVALKNATSAIFADSLSASCNNDSFVGGDLREVRRTDPETGHRIKEFYGSPSAWMSQFSGTRRLARFHVNSDGRLKK